MQGATTAFSASVIQSEIVIDHNDVGIFGSQTGHDISDILSEAFVIGTSYVFTFTVCQLDQMLKGKIGGKGIAVTD